MQPRKTIDGVKHKWCPGGEHWAPVTAYYANGDGYLCTCCKQHHNGYRKKPVQMSFDLWPACPRPLSQ